MDITQFELLGQKLGAAADLNATASPEAKPGLKKRNSTRTDLALPRVGSTPSVKDATK